MATNITVWLSRGSDESSVCGAFVSIADFLALQKDDLPQMTAVSLATMTS